MISTVVQPEAWYNVRIHADLKNVAGTFERAGV
jgi:hypothetical protein